MIEAGAPNTGSLAAHVDVVLCPSHRGLPWSHRLGSRATLQGSKAKAAPERGPSTKRSQGHYRGWDPTPSFAAAKLGSLILREGIATTLLQERLPWVTMLLYPTASKRGRRACSRYALLGTRRAGDGRRPGDRLGTVPIGPPLALVASRGPGLTHRRPRPVNVERRAG